MILPKAKFSLDSLILIDSYTHVPNSVSIISDKNNTVVANVYVGYGDGELAYDSGKSEMFVSSTESSTSASVSVISDNSNSVVATVSLPLEPAYVAYDSANGEIFVTNQGNFNSVSVISDSNNSLISLISTGGLNGGLAYDSGNAEMYLSNWGAGTVSVIPDSAILPPPPSPLPTPVPVPTPTAFRLPNPNGNPTPTASLPTPTPPTINSSDGGSWVSKTPFPSTDPGCKAVSVDGTIYVIGYTADYAYNPSVGNWTTIAPMLTPRGSFALTACYNKIYAIGGFNEKSSTSCSINEVYDPSTNKWSTAAQMPTARGQMNAAAVNGKIYVMGGRTAQFASTVNTTEIYDPATESWSKGSTMPYPVVAYSSAVVDDKIFVIGGQDEWIAINGSVGFGTPSPTPRPNPNVQFTQIYDTTTDNWSLGSPIPAMALGSGAGATAGVNAPKRIYVLGGVTPVGGSASNQNYVYDPATDSWCSAAPIPSASSTTPIVAVVNDLLYVITGSFGMTTWQYTPIGYVPSSSTNTVITATTDNGSTVDLTINGNITSSQISKVYMSTNQTTATTTLSFTVTGESGSTGFGTIIIPKSAVPYMTTPEIYIDNQLTQNQSFTQDANNYYVSYTTHFSTHEVSIVFATPSSNSPTAITPNQTSAQPSLIQMIYGAAAGLAIVIGVVVVLKLTINGKPPKKSDSKKNLPERCFCLVP